MRILILGAGDIGFQLSRRLARERTDITIVESNPERSHQARDQLDVLVVEGHAASSQSLRDAGIDHADLVAAMTDNDEVNIVACQIAKKSGVETTIARVLSAKDTKTGMQVYTRTSFFFVCRFLVPCVWGVAALAVLTDGLAVDDAVEGGDT